MNGNLYDYAIQQSRESARRRELGRVSEETGLQYSWLSKFSRGRIPGASYDRVTKLAAYYEQRQRQ